MGYLENFHYQVIGSDEKPKLVFLHGLMGSGNNWRRITPHFEQNYQILIFDQRGHGRSFKPEQGFQPEDYAEDLFKILTDLRWDKIDLLGHSMGGRNAIQFAALHPEMVRKLIIEDIGVFAQEQGAQSIEKLLNLVPVPFSSRAEARNFLRYDFVEKIKPNRQAQVLSQYFYTNIEEKEDGRFGWRFSKAAILETLRLGHLKDRVTEWESLSMPTLLIRGERSKDLTEQDYQKMQMTHVNCQAVTIRDSGHWVHFEQLDEFVRVVKAFLLS